MYPITEIGGLEVFVLLDNVSDPFSKNSEGIYGMNHNINTVYCKEKKYLTKIIVAPAMVCLCS